MTRLLLARHGETDWNRENRFQGHADPPLNAAGRAQAAVLAERLRDDGVTALYASPLRRAAETAEVVGARLALPVRLLEPLREIDVGSWSGLTREEVAERFPAGYARWLDFGEGWEDGERYDALGRRVVPALAAVAARHPGETVLAITHGGPIRALHAHAAGVSYADARRLASVVGNCEVAEFAVRDGELTRVD